VCNWNQDGCGIGVLSHDPDHSIDA
jgi:hypothetical protein